MGLEARCEVRVGRERAECRALLETDELIVRGDVRARVPFRSIREIAVRGGVLRVTHEGGTLALALGDAAAKWAERLKNPKSVLDKLGVKPGHRVVVLGAPDATLAKSLGVRGAIVAPRMAKGVDVVFLGATTHAALSRLATLERSIARNGAVWVLWKKGVPTLGEDHVRTAGKRAGLVDVKIVRYSDALSALKFVIPLARR